MLELTFQNVLEDGIGEAGFTIRDFEKTTVTKKIKAAMEKDRAAGRLRFLDIFTDEMDHRDYQYYVDAWRDMETIVVAGAGGPILGARALFEALTHPMHNMSEKFRKGGRQVLFLDNIDPDYVMGTLDVLDLDVTGFLIISPTGEDPESLSLLGIIREKLGAEYLQEHSIFITHPEEGPLRELAIMEGYNAVSLPTGLADRFLILSAASYLPLAFAGIDIKKVFTGGKRASRSYRQINFQNPAILFASIMLEFYNRRDFREIVFFPFQERLSKYAEWFEYFWSETMQKKGAGWTARSSVGARDSLTMLNSYLNGPRNRLFIIPSAKKFQRRAVVRNFFDAPALKYLEGAELGEMNFFAESILLASLRDAELANVQITHADLMEEGIAELIVFMQYTALFVSYLLDHDFLDESAGEPPRRFLLGLLGKKGFKNDKSTFSRLSTVFEKFKIRK